MLLVLYKSDLISTENNCKAAGDSSGGSCCSCGGIGSCSRLVVYYSISSSSNSSVTVSKNGKLFQIDCSYLKFSIKMSSEK